MKRDNMGWFPGVLVGSLVVIFALAFDVSGGQDQTSVAPFKVGILSSLMGQ